MSKHCKSIVFSSCVFIEDKNKKFDSSIDSLRYAEGRGYKHLHLQSQRCTTMCRQGNPVKQIQSELQIPSFRSIFSRNCKTSSLFIASSIDVKLYSWCKSAMSGQSKRTWWRDCTSVLQEQWRSLRGMRGLHMRPVSIRRLCEPHLYRVVRILSRSRMLFLCFGGVLFGFTNKYTPHRDCSSLLAFCLILSPHAFRYLSSNCFWSSSGVWNSRTRFS